MAPTSETSDVIEMVEARILILQGKRVLLSPVLAGIYGVPTKALTQAVRRNRARFPKDFMFQVSDSDCEILKSQIVTSSWGGSRRANPYAFTQEGVAMLSSVLRSDRAIRMNVAIMRAFVRLRENQLAGSLLVRLLKDFDGKLDRHDSKVNLILETLKSLASPTNDDSQIGFRP